MKFFNNKPILLLNSKYRQISSFILTLLLFVFSAVYIFQPVSSEVSMPLFYLIFIVMLISNIIYFRTKKKLNYLDFDTIFILIYCIICFSTTFFYEIPLLYRALFLGFPVSNIYINRGNLLALIGLLCYMIGSLSISNYIKCSKKNYCKVINTLFLSIFLFFLIVLLIASGGLTSYKNIYTGQGKETGITNYLILMIVCITIVMVATELYNKIISPSYRIRKISVFSIFLLILLLLWAGNRTAASMLTLPFLGIYAMYFFNVRLKEFIIFIFLAIFSMWIVQNTRANVAFELSSPVLIISDLTIPSRQLYSALEYVDQRGYTYGLSMLAGIINLVPFLPSLVVNSIIDYGGNPNEIGSAELLTDFTYEKMNAPRENRIGLGTTVVADVYLSFGLFGVVFFMFLLGYFINKLLLKSLTFNYLALIALSAMLANSVFMLRAGYTHPIRYIIWSVVLALLNKFFVSYIR